MKNQRIICSGPPGAGKTSVLACLSSEFGLVSEPARRVLSAQRAIGGTGTGDRDPAKFVSLMLDMALSDYHAHQEAAGPVLFDRALPDLLAYAAYYELSAGDVQRASDTFRYAETVFWFPAWEEIYTVDDERTLAFEGAKAFGERVSAAYASLNYRLVDVPRGSIEARAAFLRAQLA